ncbi:hypothetical protein HMPREF0650_0956 [Hoylesella buccalis ATCC 35310]|uniref:Uncharacterized protein n=1 Tax=Hoylesella buccalis ATCC 35310 TaxID=679190 RepID=D1W740_9BACT|nr:hypothetical protein HMPREF0650_0956 [Hoylesella buccalis ATCC 35310]
MAGTCKQPSQPPDLIYKLAHPGIALLINLKAGSTHYAVRASL